ncbi:MAG TPA: hypothetical protein VIV06_03295, partial [Candidatus Limnocylindrales bacterium]
GEIIAWNDWADLENSALAADGAWLGSTPHREIMLSPEYNYVGVGLGLSTRGKRLWTAVFLKGPDRTSPWARAYQPVRMATYTSSSTVGLRVTWRGADVPLQVLTSGLRDFQVQRRIDGGTWSYLKTSTTATGLTAGYRLGHRYEFRVRARDNAGNLGSWTAPVSISV